MPSEQHIILEMLQNQKISVDEAERLLNALDHNSKGDQPFRQHVRSGIEEGLRKRWRRHSSRNNNAQFGPRFIHIEIDEVRDGERREKHRIKVPLKLLKAGINLSGLLPRDARDSIAAKLKQKKIEVDPFSLRGMNINEFASALQGIDMDLDGTHIRVHVDAAEDKTEAPDNTEMGQHQDSNPHDIAT